MIKSTRRIGKICDRHPELLGERLSSNNSCVRCHRDRVNANRLKRYHNDPEYHVRSREKQNQSYARSHKTQYIDRRMSKMLRTPSWANKSKIREIYLHARELGMTVDHILPLRGELVSGLHVENNLQLMPRSANSSKGNKYVVGASKD